MSTMEMQHYSCKIILVHRKNTKLYCKYRTTYRESIYICKQRKHFKKLHLWCFVVLSTNLLAKQFLSSRLFDLDQSVFELRVEFLALNQQKIDNKGLASTWGCLCVHVV